MSPRAPATRSRRSSATGFCAAAGWASAGSPAATPGARVAMTPSARPASRSAQLVALARLWAGPLLLFLLPLLVAACFPSSSASPGASGASPTPSGTPQQPLQPSPPGADPVSLLAFLFTPIFQAMFIVLAGVYYVLHQAGVPGAIGISIIVLTLLVRALLIPLFRRQLVSQKRMQMLQPEFAEIRKRFKDRKSVV